MTPVTARTELDCNLNTSVVRQSFFYPIFEVFIHGWNDKHAHTVHYREGVSNQSLTQRLRTVGPFELGVMTDVLASQSAIHVQYARVREL